MGFRGFSSVEQKACRGEDFEDELSQVYEFSVVTLTRLSWEQGCRHFSSSTSP